MANEMVTLPADAIPDIRKIIAIGMQALGELERIESVIGIAEIRGQQVHEDFHPVHPTGTHVIGDFASALMWLECATPAKA